MLGLLLSWPMLIVLLFTSLLFEHNEWRWSAVFFTMVTATVAFFMFDMSWMEGLIVGAAWLPIGVVWSFWRWKKYCTSTVSKVKDGKVDANYVNLDVYNNIDKIVMWIIVWPFSMVESFIGDIIDVVYDVIKGTLNRFYAKIANDALAEIEKLKK